MFNPSYLFLSRHNIYYFRFPIPSALHPQGKTQDIKLSLQTRCPQEALHLARTLAYFGDIVINNLIVHTMDFHEIRAVLSDHFKALREKVKDRIKREGQLGDSTKQMHVDNQAWAKEALQHNDYDIVGTNEEIDNLVSKYDLALQSDSSEYELFRIEYIKAYRDFHKSALDYNARFGGFNFTTDPSIMAKATALPSHPKIKLANAIDQYIEDGLKKRRWKPKTAKSYRAELQLILDFMGQDCRLHLSKQDMASIADMVSKIPTNPRRSKELKQLNIEELMATDELEHPRMNLKTLKKYISNYSTFYEWAARRYDGLERNCFTDFIKDIIISSGAVRDPFSPEEVRAMLDVLIHNREGLVKMDHHKWGTLIALYTGARRNEIGQLELDDIKEVDGVLCFDINKESKYGTKKKLKTPKSARIIPIHPDMEKYGFLDYVETMRSQNHARLFPKLSYDAKDEGYGRAIGRWFNDTLLPYLEIKDENVVFHCFRHTISDRLRNAGVAEEIVNALTGHANVGVGQQKYFKQGYKSKILAEAMEKLNHSI